MKTLEQEIEEMQTVGFGFSFVTLKQALMWLGEMEMLKRQIAMLEAKQTIASVPAQESVDADCATLQRQVNGMKLVLSAKRTQLAEFAQENAEKANRIAALEAQQLEQGALQKQLDEMTRRHDQQVRINKRLVKAWNGATGLGVKPAPQHSDDIAVECFAEAMKAKLAKKREQGHGGWETARAEHLSYLLHEHVDKGDPIDVANFCMMLHHLNDRIWEKPSKSPLSDLEPKYKFSIGDDHQSAEDDTMFTAGINLQEGGKQTHWNAIEVHGTPVEAVARRDFVLSVLVRNQIDKTKE